MVKVCIQILRWCEKQIILDGEVRGSDMSYRDRTFRSQKCFRQTRLRNSSYESCWSYDSSGVNRSKAPAWAL